jgi:uncharacterized protein YcfL
MINANLTGALQKLISLPIATISVTTVATASDKTLTFVSAMLVNNTNADIIADLYWYDAQDAVQNLVWRGTVPADDSRAVTEISLPLRAGDELRAKGSAGLVVNASFIMNVQVR